MKILRDGLHSDDLRSQGTQTVIDVLVSTINLVDVVNGAFAFSTQRGYQQTDPCADVGRRHGYRASLPCDPTR